MSGYGVRTSYPDVLANAHHVKAINDLRALLAANDSNLAESGFTFLSAPRSAVADQVSVTWDTVRLLDSETCP